MTKKIQESVDKFAFGYHSTLNNLFINSNYSILVSIGNLKSLYDLPLVWKTSFSQRYGKTYIRLS